MTNAEILNALILIATIFAIVAGPIAAVQVSRRNDNERAKSERRFKIFRDLMATRNLVLDPSHVIALNLIEVEFYESKEIRAAYTSYRRHMSTPLLGLEAQDVFYADRRRLFFELIHLIAENLGYNYDKMELSDLAYSPDGWIIDQDMQRENVRLLQQLLKGERPLAITQNIGGGTPYTPRPD